MSTEGSGRRGRRRELPRLPTSHSNPPLPLWHNFSMADTSHLTEYAPLIRHRREMQAASQNRRKRLAITAAVVVTLATTGYWLSPPLGIMLAGIGAMALFFTSITGGSSVPSDVMTGVEGEARVLGILERLPDDHVLFNQVQVPDPSLPNGRRELDFVVVAPAGVFVVEVKNTPGLIYVDPDNRQWQVARRAGCGSRPGWNAMDNPIGQVKAQTSALEQWLLRQGAAVRARPVVCFARPGVMLENTTTSPVTIATADDLLDTLDGGRNGAGHDRTAVTRALRSLTQKTKVARAA